MFEKLELQELSVSDAVWAEILAEIRARRCCCASWGFLEEPVMWM